MIDADDDDRVRAHIIGHLQRSIGDGDAGPKTLGGVALKRLAFAQIEIMDMIGLASHEPARLPRQIGGDGIGAERGDILFDDYIIDAHQERGTPFGRSEEHTSELQSLMRISYAVFCLKKKTHTTKRLLQT